MIKPIEAKIIDETAFLDLLDKHIIYFCGNFPLLLTIKGGIRYIEIAIIFFCGLLFITLPVFPFLSDGNNILFALFDTVCFIGNYIYGGSGVISAIITYVLCVWIITGVICFLQRKIHNGI